MKNKEVRRLTCKELEEETAKLNEWLISHGYMPCVVAALSELQHCRTGL